MNIIMRGNDDLMTEFFCTAGRFEWWQDHKILVGREFTNHVNDALAKADRRPMNETHPILAHSETPDGVQ